MSSLESILGSISQAPLWWGLTVLFLGALIEYVFPPFPGDTIVLLGAFLIGTGVYPLAPTFFAITLGSLAGMVGVYYAGTVLHPRYSQLRQRPNRLISNQAIDRIEAGFHRFGDWLILFNRFLPAVRAPFFLVAGLLRRSPLRVILLGAISLLAWNSLIIFAGYQVGNHWDSLQGLLSAYNQVILSALAVLIVAWLVRKWYRSRKPHSQA